MDLATERFLRVEAIFQKALEAPEETRALLIEAQCKGDAQLMAEVRLLLEACAEEEQMQASRPPTANSGEDDRCGGKRVGPYQIERLLGRGGMGAVYLAHRDDGQFEQKVAVKLIDLPLATELFRERFRQERQILAGLQHPYIAHLLDGGVTAKDELYLVMEFVDGIPIHRFCEQHNLSQVQRLTMFLCVCEAVQFAHHNFVVHRDLKAENILVAADGTPRLLDFGTAKLLSPAPGRADSAFTREGFLSFTPQYASPEQVLGNPITTASDTYSLGVLLFLLLTGSLPYELKELTTAEMLRVICSEPPRRPSQIVDSPTQIDADLEAILLKALRKEPRERYLTAEQLAVDIRAYLDKRPVAARRGTVRYRAGKFIGRHKWGLAAALLLIVTLLAGIAGVLWQSSVANRERRRAEARSADLRQLSNSLLSELDEAIKQLPGSTGAQQLLVTRVLEHLDRMAKDAQGDRQTQLDLVDAYTRLGNLQGNAYDQNLGDSQGALTSLDKAAALAQPLATDSHDQEAIRAFALVEQSRSEVLWQIDRTQEAIPVMRRALNAFDTLAADPHSSAATVFEAATAYGTFGDELGQNGTASLGDPAGAVAAYRTTLDLDSRVLRMAPSFLRAKRGIAISRMKIGNVEMETDPAGALKDFQIALALAGPPKDPSDLPALRLRAMLLRKQADASARIGQYAAAVSLFEQALDMERRLTIQDPKDLRAAFDLVTVLDDEGISYEDAADPVLAVKPDERKRNLLLAEGKLVQAAAVLDRLLKQDPANDVWRASHSLMTVRISAIKWNLQQKSESLDLLKRELETLRALARKKDVSPMLLDQAANAFLIVEPGRLKDPQLAIACAEREVEMSHRERPLQLLTLAQAYRAAGQTERSRIAAREGLELLPHLSPRTTKPNIRKSLEFQTH